MLGELIWGFRGYTRGSDYSTQGYAFNMVHNDDSDPSYALSTNFREYGGMCMGF